MRRSLLVAGLFAAVVAGAVLPAGVANAADVATAPPTDVAVTGGNSEAVITWAAPAVDPADPITGWTVAMTPAEDQPNGGIDTLAPDARSDQYGALTPGRTYSFAVSAVTAAGTSAPITVRWTQTVRHVESLYALAATPDPTTGAFALERRPVSGGAWTTVLADAGAGWTVNGAGTVYAVSADGTTITSYPENGDPRVVATGLAVSGPDLQVDVLGDLFFVNDGTLVELGPGATVPTAITPVSGAWVVGPGGSVATATTGGIAVWSAPGAAPTVRPVDVGQGVAVPIALDGSGNVYVRATSSDPQFASPIGVLTSAATALTWLSGSQAAGALASDGDYFTLSTATWCPAAAELLGVCTPNPVVLAVLERSAAGTTTPLPVTGLVLGDGPDPAVVAASATGAVFVSVTSGPDAGLVEVPAGGGAAQPLDTASFSQMIVR